MAGMKKSLNCYYSLTDESETYWIAMGAWPVSIIIHLLNLLFEFYILNTNLLIPGQPVGKTDGSRLLKILHRIDSDAITLSLKWRMWMRVTQMH